MENSNKAKKASVKSSSITTIKKGFWDSEPFPVKRTSGNNPSDAINGVNTTGQTLTPSKLPSVAIFPDFIF